MKQLGYCMKHLASMSRAVSSQAYNWVRKLRRGMWVEYKESVTSCPAHPGSWVCAEPYLECSAL